MPTAGISGASPREPATETEPTFRASKSADTERGEASAAYGVCDLFARNCPKGQGMSGEDRLIFVTAYPCRTMILRKWCQNNPCLPGERETAPSLGVRLVSVGRKREAKSETAKSDSGNAWESDYGQHKSRCIEVSSCRTSQSRMTGWPKIGNGLKVYRAHRRWAFTRKETRHKAPP